MALACVWNMCPHSRSSRVVLSAARLSDTNPSVRPSADTNSQCPTCGSNEVIALEPDRRTGKVIIGIALIIAAPVVLKGGLFFSWTAGFNGQAVADIPGMLTILTASTLLIVGIVVLTRIVLTRRTR